MKLVNIRPILDLHLRWCIHNLQHFVVSVLSLHVFAKMVQIVSPSDEEHEQGDVIPNGSIVRLQHVRTRKWLHSHLHQSPISGNLEV